MRAPSSRRELNDLRAETNAGRLSRNDAPGRVVQVVRAAGLRPVTAEDVPEPIDEDGLAVVCFMAVVS